MAREQEGPDRPAPDASVLAVDDVRTVVDVVVGTPLSDEQFDDVGVAESLDEVEALPDGEPETRAAALLRRLWLRPPYRIEYEFELVLQRRRRPPIHSLRPEWLGEDQLRLQIGLECAALHLFYAGRPCAVVDAGADQLAALLADLAAGHDALGEQETAAVAAVRSSMLAFLDFHPPTEPPEWIEGDVLGEAPAGGTGRRRRSRGLLVGLVGVLMAAGLAVGAAAWQRSADRRADVDAADAPSAADGGPVAGLPDSAYSSGFWTSPGNDRHAAAVVPPGASVDSIVDDDGWPYEPRFLEAANLTLQPNMASRDQVSARPDDLLRLRIFVHNSGAVAVPSLRARIRSVLSRTGFVRSYVATLTTDSGSIALASWVNVRCVLACPADAVYPGNILDWATKRRLSTVSAADLTGTGVWIGRPSGTEDRQATLQPGDSLVVEFNVLVK